MAADSTGKIGPVSVEASEFAATCLQLVDEVAAGGAEVVITKDGRPVSRLVPCAEAPPATAEGGAMADGAYKGRLRILGDIVSPPDLDWDTFMEDELKNIRGETG